MAAICCRLAHACKTTRASSCIPHFLRTRLTGKVLAKLTFRTPDRVTHSVVSSYSFAADVACQRHNAPASAATRRALPRAYLVLQNY